MNRKELFDECVKEAIELGRKYVEGYASDDLPTIQEWELALLLFKKRI